jgi:hypothetical protein
MRVLALICFFLIAENAFAIPEGVSTWIWRDSCNRQCKKEGNRASSADLVLVRRGGRVCGIVEQDYGLAAGNKSPYGKIAGAFVGNTLVVSFTDSFADRSSFGTAGLRMSGARLRWETVSSPPAGYLWLDKKEFRAARVDPRHVSNTRKVCEDFFSGSSPDSVRKFLAKENY